MHTTNFERQGIHKRNERLENLLFEVNSMLSQAEYDAVCAYNENKFPIIFIVGCPRSGTTLFMQWLASLGYFSYPTNLLSRFFSAPYIGAKIQLMLTTHDFNGELFDFNASGLFNSRLGKTKGVLAPNEFWYFWRRFFNFTEINYLDDYQLLSVNSQLLMSELAAIEDVFGLPFAMKAMIINWNIPFISKIFRKSLFIHIKREPIFNIQSLLNARKDYYGDVRAWYSFKPPEYDELKRRNPFEQVVGQIYYTNLAIEKGLESVQISNKLTINYDQFCLSPNEVFCQIKEKYESQGYSADWAYLGAASFESSKEIKLADDDLAAIRKALFDITGETI